MPRPLPSLAALLLASACVVQPGQPGCQPRPVEVVNATTRSVEQLYYGLPGASGGDLLGGIEMAPGETRSFLFAGTVGPVLRAVWTDGRAVELRGLDPRRNSRVVLAEGIIRVG